MVRTAAGIYAGAIVIALVEQAIPGGPSASLAPGLVALVVAPLVAAFGPRLPREVLALLGPLGAALIAFALQSTSRWTDGAVLYMWPVAHLTAEARADKLTGLLNRRGSRSRLTMSGPRTLQRGFGQWFTWSAFAPASRAAPKRRTAASRLATPHRVRIAENGDLASHTGGNRRA